MSEWKKFCLNQEVSILEAMKNLTETGARFCVVISDDFKLRGSLTDGDIRSAILKGLSVNDAIHGAMNTNPIVASNKLNHFQLEVLMKANEITHIPIIDDNGKLIQILSLKDMQLPEPRKENAVVLMAGGLGSRLGDLTTNCPKPMLKLADKPILEIIIENIKECGFHNFFLSVNYKSEMIESYFGNGSRHGINIQYIREKERMGTAGSLSLFKPFNDLPMIVMNGDVLTKVNFSSLVDFHTTRKLDACMCTIRHDYQVPFGVVHSQNDLVLKIEEKPTYSCIVNAGIYTINPLLLNLLPEDTFFDMPALMEKIVAEKNKIGTYEVQDYWLDIGRRDDFHRAEIDYKNKFK